jgi:hypothetical protein
MIHFIDLPLSIKLGVIALVFGLVTFLLSWYGLGRPIPGYRVMLLPGNLTLSYIWHPIFTEEINMFPKLILLLFGQFLSVMVLAEVIIRLFKSVRG